MSLWDCIVGPALYRIYGALPRNYEPYNIERYTDRVIRYIDAFKTILTYTSPLIAIYLYQRGFDLSTFASSHYVKLLVAMSSVYLLSHVFRGVSRSINPTYKEFIRSYKTTVAVKEHHRDEDAARMVLEAREQLRQKYDYQFEKWPVDFHWSEGKYAHDRPAKLLPVSDASYENLTEAPLMQGVSWIIAHTIARCLLYPGSMRILSKLLEFNLITGRNFLIEKFNAKRYKLLARDNNQIDSIFIDNRRPTDPRHNGNTLVIVCEGNAGFYEIGSITTPLNLSYSALGWNHPGFAGSTGSPYPENEANAMEAVVNFAVTRLGFPLENILIFAWSIGGFPAAWAASNYPEVKGVILDASFDDVLPLARARMMPFMAPIVDPTIRYYFNLNVAAYLDRYNGPVRFIRRLRDEIIPLDQEDPLKTNRGNFLLRKLLAKRFPNLMPYHDIISAVDSFLYSENTGPVLRHVSEEEVMRALKEYCQKNDITHYPVEIDADTIGMNLAKQIILYLASRTMSQVDTTHCTPLPPSLFQLPFDLFASISNKN